MSDQPVLYQDNENYNVEDVIESTVVRTVQKLKKHKLDKTLNKTNDQINDSSSNATTSDSQQNNQENLIQNVENIAPETPDLQGQKMKKQIKLKRPISSSHKKGKSAITMNNNVLNSKKKTPINNNMSNQSLQQQQKKILLSSQKSREFPSISNKNNESFSGRRQGSGKRLTYTQNTSNNNNLQQQQNNSRNSQREANFKKYNNKYGSMTQVDDSIQQEQFQQQSQSQNQPNMFQKRQKNNSQPQQQVYPEQKQSFNINIDMAVDFFIQKGRKLKEKIEQEEIPMDFIQSSIIQNQVFHIKYNDLLQKMCQSKAINEEFKNMQKRPFEKIEKFFIEKLDEARNTWELEQKIRQKVRSVKNSIGQKFQIIQKQIQKEQQFQWDWESL